MAAAITCHTQLTPLLKQQILLTVIVQSQTDVSSGQCNAAEPKQNMIQGMKTLPGKDLGGKRSDFLSCVIYFYFYSHLSCSTSTPHPLSSHKNYKMMEKW